MLMYSSKYYIPLGSGLCLCLLVIHNLKLKWSIVFGLVKTKSEEIL